MSNYQDLQRTIDAAWENRDSISPATKGEVRDAVETALNLLDSGKARVAEKIDGSWVVHQWLKKAVLLSFRLNDMTTISGAPGGASWWDKVPSKFAGMDEAAFRSAGFRAVPGAIVRHSAYIAPGVVLMPSFVNLGAYVDAGTMVDVGNRHPARRSAERTPFGRRRHWWRAGAAGQSVIIEDNCFIGARSEVVEGVIVGGGNGPLHGRVHWRIHQDHRSRHGPGARRPRAALLRGRAGYHAG